MAPKKKLPKDGNGLTSLADLVADPANTRKHTDRNVGMIADALQEVGAARSGVIDENNVLLAGNATAEAMKSAGMDKVRVVDADGDEWVVVRRKGLTADQKTRLSMYDNRAAELARWDVPQLKSLDDTLLDGLFTTVELGQLFKAHELPDGSAQQDPSLASDCLVEIRASKEVFAGELKSTLEMWSELDGVEIDIS